MNEIFVERSNEILRVGIKEDKLSKAFFIEEDNGLVSPGQIYKGIVKNIVPAIKCAFVDIGDKTNAYMYLDSKFNNKHLRKGDEVIVEILKEAMGTKGAKVTSAFTIAGRYSVLSTIDKEINFSKKIYNKEFKDEVLNNIKINNDFGIIVRTNAEEVTISELSNEIENLGAKFRDIEEKSKYSIKPGILYDGGGIIEKVLRDFVDNETERIVVNNGEDFLGIREYIKSKGGIKTKIEIYQEERTLFDKFGLEKDILSLRNNKVMLLSGGYLVIDKTEAMNVIDVNSGKNIKNNSIKKTALETNLEAARESARQIILRNLGGIIVIDFIDLDNENDKRLVLKELESCFKFDKNKTIIYPFTELNLIQIARRKRGKSIIEYIEENCSNCKGNGKKIKFSYVSILIRNEVVKFKANHGIQEVLITLNEKYKNDLSKGFDKFLVETTLCDSVVYLNYSYDDENFKIEPVIFENQRKNLKEFKVYG